MTQVSSMPSMNKVAHSIALEQYVQINGPLLSLSEFSLFQVDFYLLPILFCMELCVMENTYEIFRANVTATEA